MQNTECLPNPYVPYEIYLEAAVCAATTFGAGVLVTTNNDATYLPVSFPCDAVVTSIGFAAANGTGNYDLGLYDPDLRRLASSGSTAMSAAGVKTLSLGALKVYGGVPYYAALALSDASGQVVRGASTSAYRGLGNGMEASALPLPSTATPVSTRLYGVPLFAFGVR